MSPYVGPKEIIRIVMEGMRRNDPDARVIEELIAKGVPSHEAPTLFGSIRTAVQAGVQSVRNPGAPVETPKDPLLAEAFKVGRRSIRSDLSGSKLRRVLLILAILTVIALVLILVLP